ncbi:hypothetical protein QUB49_33905 [Microcoleus sp. AT9_B4]
MAFASASSLLASLSCPCQRTFSISIDRPSRCTSAAASLASFLSWASSSRSAASVASCACSSASWVLS